ncbi:hypothetical protein [Endozoicomonas sp. 8E]|uniref:hypothetical protein n=1 Tax=Endozoicomonas sp. 8E TaxID=3035692 RepID=UPI002938F958|nr:hypothetical protein [Endozoicomonas sp. 8E]WOG28312.1 hypothetical protein P6910_01280 [Endozoicomonas sp. 8E]
MSILHLNLKQRQNIGTAMIALLMFLLLQVCLMESSQAMVADQSDMPMMMPANAYGMADDLSMDHDCCKPSPAEHLQKANQVCPDCDSEDRYIPFSHPDSKPTFTLLYVVAELILLDAEPSQDWISAPPFSVYRSQPYIYLANVSFLE